ncbi:hypothetical protein BGW37DRAFT_507486 [Umbelopsis sp. PMI_123]|nr:hypothetical protein BGW37DRAFT_507486 [Umbelopsis sp. PMI_123]
MNTAIFDIGRQYQFFLIAYVDGILCDLPSLTRGIWSWSTLYLYNTLSILQSIYHAISFFGSFVVAYMRHLKNVPFFIPSTFKHLSEQ